MKKIILIFLLLLNTGFSGPMQINDYGNLLSPDKFTTHCTIYDPGISGSITIEAYSNGQISCVKLQELYSEIYIHANVFLGAQKYDTAKRGQSKTLVLRILTLAELNDPKNFSQTDKQCMHNIRCDSGAYFGRTFYSDASSNINVYVVYPESVPPSWKYSFTSNIKHELMHVILYRYQWTYFLSRDTEHALIDKFLVWDRKNNI